MTTVTHLFVGTRISGASLGVLMVERAWKPATFPQYTTDNSTAVSARRSRHT